MVKILLIEDHPATAEAMVTILKMKGIETEVAFEGITGLQKAVSGNPDLILLDVMMPELNGIEVLKRLKADSKTSNIPVVIASVKATEEDIKLGKESGAVDYITKPFAPDILLETIRKYL